MTYGELKDTASMFLIGDNVLPKEDNRVLAAVRSAYTFAATKCTALKLLTANKDDRILRMGPGNTYIRKPKLPALATDELDIDDELGQAIARLLAHYIAKEIKMKDYHKGEALEIMRDYEGKVQEFIEESQKRGEYIGIGEES